jgi:hypothetical protein
MVKLPETPLVRVAAAGLVICGAWPTVRVKFWVASGSPPLLAVMVKL